MNGTSQDKVFAFLSSPKAHDGAGPVERVDTHISAVFLVDGLAYKVKRAVRLPFLDFSALAARRAACEAEIEVNSRFAPWLYLRVAAVTREADGHFAIDGEGEVVEWMVVMRRFPAEDQFDRLAARGALTPKLVRELATQVAEAHTRAPERPDKGGAAAMRWTVENNAECFAVHVPEVFAAEAVERLTTESRRALERVAPLLERRRREGRVRQCHGDLHLANICLFDGRPTLFDAIEFSEDIACIDVHYDLAFLLMDLEHRGLRTLANVAFNGYAEDSADYGALAALPLFLSCRAAIRAHIAATTARHEPEAEAERLRTEAREYLRQALDYLHPPPPRLVAVGGLSGSGKSRLGRELAPWLGGAPGAVVLRSDVLRKQIMGVPVLERLPPEAYGEDMTRRTYDRLYRLAAEALAAGHSVVADAVFARPGQREAVARVAKDAGAAFDGLWVEAPPEVMRQRVASRRRNASDATVEVLERQLSYDLGEVTWRRVDSSGPRDETVARARAILGV